MSAVLSRIQAQQHGQDAASGAVHSGGKGHCGGNMGSLMESEEGGPGELGEKVSTSKKVAHFHGEWQTGDWVA